MQCSLTRPRIGSDPPPMPRGMDDHSVFALYEVRTPWKSTGYLITVAREREHKFKEAMSMSQDMITCRKLFETRDRPFALLMSTYQEF